MNRIPFSESELKIVGSYLLPGVYGAPAVERPRYDYPITPKENMTMMMRGEKPLWIPNQWRDNNIVCPYVVPDFYARAYGGTDWFGIEWQFEPLTAAGMVKPGTRRLSDITNWKKEIVFPDLNAIDWAKDVADNFSMLPNDRFTYFVIQNGIFERIADLTSFEDVFVYLLEEQEAMNDFLDALTDWHIEFIKIIKKYYNPDMILWHDDMGSQKAPFFSPALFKELYTPHYQRITKACHDLGMFISLHSCGNVGLQIPNFIESGFDAWEGQDSANDRDAIMEQYGDKIYQVGNFIIEGDLTDEEAAEQIHRLVDGRARNGRFACRFTDARPNKGPMDMDAELYRYSRIAYSK